MASPQPFNFPIVRFSEDSASGVECAMALARLSVGGNIIEEAFNHPVETQMIASRTLNWVLVMIANTPDSPTETAERLAINDPQAGHAMLALQDSLGINAEGLGGGIFRDLILQKLMEFGMRFFDEWLRRQFPSPQPNP